MNLVMFVWSGIQVVICQMGMMFNRFIVSAAVNVTELLNQTGAASDNGALAPLNNKVQELGGGAVAIVRNAMIYVVAIALLVCGGLMALHGHNANKRDEDKSAFGWTFVGGVIIFASISILIFAQKIGESLFNV